jgi:hypothetical protein
MPKSRAIGIPFIARRRSAPTARPAIDRRVMSIGDVPIAVGR